MTAFGWAKLWPYALSLSLHGALLGTGAAVYLAERRPADSISVVHVHFVAGALPGDGSAEGAPGISRDRQVGSPVAQVPSEPKVQAVKSAQARHGGELSGPPRHDSAHRERKAREPDAAQSVAARPQSRAATPPPPRSPAAAAGVGEANALSAAGRGSDSHANGAADRPVADATGSAEGAVAFPPTPVDTGALVASVRDGIDAVKRYPRMARQAGQQGRALIKFRLLRSGAVADLRVIDSSGFPILDDAALSAVRRAAPFAEQGRRIGAESMEVVLPVVFRLR